MTLVHVQTGEIVVVWNGKVHPVAEGYKEYTPARLKQLADDIAHHGLDYPITLAPDGTLLDGRHRRLACEMAGVKPRFEVHTGDPVEHINSRNLMRMHLTRAEEAAERAVIVAALKGQGMSQREIAKAAGVSRASARRDMNKVGHDGPPCSPPVKGRDGKTYSSAEAVSKRRDSVASLVAEGLSQREIAERLGMAQSTVSYDIKALGIPYKKQPPSEAVDRWTRVAELAAGSSTRAQIAAAVGISELSLNAGCRQRGIEIIADRAMNNRKRIESDDVMHRLIDGFNISEQVLAMVDYSTLDRDRLDGWIASLARSIKSLQDIKRKLTKETTQ